MLNLTVGKFMNSLSHEVDLPTVAAGSSLQEVVRVMVKNHRRHIIYVVDSDNKLKGMISLDDLKDIIFRYYLNGKLEDAMVVTEYIEELFLSEKAEDVMSKDIVFCRKNEPLHDVIARMVQHDIKYLPLIDMEGRVVSELDILDVLELWLKEEEEI